jgi:hypothetical protein
MRPHTLLFTIETVSMRLSLHGQRPTSDTLLLNGVYPCLAYAKCGTSTFGKTWRDTDTTWVPIRIGRIHNSQDFPVVPPCMAKRNELVWLYKK